MNIEDVRREFPITSNGVAYLDHASKSPFSNAVKEAALWFIEQRQKRMFYFILQLWNTRKNTGTICQSGLAHSIAKELSWNLNTTESMNLLIDQINWKEGDEIIVFNKDFPANVFPFLALQERYGVKVKQVEDDNFFYSEKDYVSLISSKTKIAHRISCKLFNTGSRFIFPWRAVQKAWCFILCGCCTSWWGYST